jgi:hypothetical protein
MKTCGECRWFTEKGKCKKYYPTVTEAGTYWVTVDEAEPACSLWEVNEPQDLRSDTEQVYDAILIRKWGYKKLEAEFKAWTKLRFKTAVLSLLKERKIVKNTVGAATYLSLPEERVITAENKQEVIAKPPKLTIHEKITLALKKGEWVDYWTIRLAADIHGSQEEINEVDSILQGLVKERKVKYGKRGMIGVYKLL